jgi:site-specific recombinase XerD
MHPLHTTPHSTAPLTKLRDGAFDFARKCLEVGSIDAYSSSRKDFLEFCDTHGVPSFPAEPWVVAAYVKWLVEVKRRKASTINSKLSAIKDMYRFSGIPSPTDDPLVASARSAANKIAPPPQQREPLLRAHLDKMASVMDSAETQDVRDFLMLLLAYRAALREDELVNLRKEEVWSEKLMHPTTGRHTTVLMLCVSSEKPNPQKRRADYNDRRCSTIVVGQDIDLALCPVQWFNLYAQMRDPEAQEFFHSSKGEAALQPASFRHIVIRWLKRIGVNPRGFGGHSPRAGAATEAIRNGADLLSVKRLGRWKSDAVYLYIHPQLSSQLLVQDVLGGVQAPARG